MKRWQIVYELPLEVWVDIFSFPWITREEFGKIVDKIGNFKFTEHAQFFLHDWGKRKLNYLAFRKDGLYKYVDYVPYRLEVPQAPLPENIKSFDHISISYFDATTIDFLDRIMSLLTNLKFNLVIIPPSCLENLRTILTNLTPFLDGTHSLSVSELTLPVMRQSFHEKFANLRVLHYFPNVFSGSMVPENVNTIVDWLTQPDGPRLCELHSPGDNQLLKLFSAEIRQQFLTATTPCTFAVNMSSYRQVAEFHPENGIGEVLHGALVGDGRERVFQITRHAANWNTEQLQEWIRQNTKEMNQNRIQIYNPTIGSIGYAAQMDVPNANEEQDIQQPSTSKRA